MSWKSLVTAGLLCVLATPVFAAAPTLSLAPGGTAASNNLNASGQWVWNVNITPDYSAVPDASGTPVAAELGFTSDQNVVTATQGSGFDTLNPGKSIFGFESNTGCNANGNPCGIQINPTGTKQVFAAVGSPNATTGALQFLQLTVARPVTASAGTDSLTTITVSGAYGSKGRIAQITGGTSPNYTTTAFDNYGGAGYTFTMRARAGDANLDGTISGGDFAALQQHFNLNAGNNRWQDGDFNGDGNVTGGDFALLQQNFGAAHNYTVGPVVSGAGSGLGSSNVPEPASVALLALAALGGLGVVRRKR